MDPQPRFFQGVYAFAGRGLEEPFQLADELTYSVPESKRAQLIYFRGGNSSPEMIYVVLLRDGKPMRYFPIGAKGNTHVQLAVVEDLVTLSRLEVRLAAPEKISGVVVVDFGLLEF
jgi:hypothetical protein